MLNGKVQKALYKIPWLGRWIETFVISGIIYRAICNNDVGGAFVWKDPLGKGNHWLWFGRTDANKLGRQWFSKKEKENV